MTSKQTIMDDIDELTYLLANLVRIWKKKPTNKYKKLIVNTNKVRKDLYKELDEKNHKENLF